jgi:hypothetical protein
MRVDFNRLFHANNRRPPARDPGPISDAVPKRSRLDAADLVFERAHIFQEAIRMRNVSAVSLEQARTFVTEAVLPEPPKGRLETVGPEGATDKAFTTAKNQAAVVGSDIMSFVKGVTADQRQDVINSTLLAQLVATSKVKVRTEIYHWYRAYFDALKNLGWLVQEESFAEYHEASERFEAHEAILGVATALLGASPAALTLIKATLDSLKKMGHGSPWLTLFNQESQAANTARFQITVAEPDQKGFLVTLMAFGLEAKASFTQVLFFKFRANDVTLRHYSGQITIDSEVLTGVRDLVRQKIAKHTAAFVRKLPDF